MKIVNKGTVHNSVTVTPGKVDPEKLDNALADLLEAVCDAFEPKDGKE